MNKIQSGKNHCGQNQNDTIRYDSGLFIDAIHIYDDRRLRLAVTVLSDKTVLTD